jgi:hypothetical protein
MTAVAKSRSERRGGELLAEMRERGERSTGFGFQESQRATPAPTLDDLGVTKHDSSRWQALAAIPEDSFDMALTRLEQLAADAGVSPDWLREHLLLAVAKRMSAAERKAAKAAA